MRAESQFMKKNKVMLPRASFTWFRYTSFQGIKHSHVHTAKQVAFWDSWQVLPHNSNLVQLTIPNQHQGALPFAASISDLASVCSFILLSEMVQDELDDTRRDVMTLLVWLEKNTQEMDLNHWEKIFVCVWCCCFYFTCFQGKPNCFVFF